MVADATPFGEMICESAALTWMRDPFDRSIAAQAIAAGCLLVTADQTLRERPPAYTLWA